MFISLSKTITRFGGFRLGVGFRLNKKNALWISLIIMFISIVKLMWYMMILCGWMIYAMFYGMYWCTKKIIRACSKNKSNNAPQKTAKNTNAETSKDYAPEQPETNDFLNSSPEYKSPKKKSDIVRWVIGILFILFAFVTGFHYASLFLLGSAFLMFPLPFMQTFWRKINIKTTFVIILSVLFVFIGMLTSPSSNTNDSISEDTNATITENKNNNSAKPNNSTSNNDSTSKEIEETTAKPEETTNKSKETAKPKETTSTSNNEGSKEEKVEMVWVSSTGKKYHSYSGCSNMNSPSEISLEDAEKHGYTPCSRCH